MEESEEKTVIYDVENVMSYIVESLSDENTLLYPIIIRILLLMRMYHVLIVII
jgi:hypothetical protein